MCKLRRRARVLGKRMPPLRRAGDQSQKPWQEPKERPYSHRVEMVIRHVDRQYFGLLSGLLLLIPALICLINDMLLEKRITWSIYVIGALMVIFVVVIMPLLFKKRRPLLFILLDTFAVLLYLLMIDLIIGGPDWFVPLAMPIVIVLGIFLRAAHNLVYQKTAETPVIICRNTDLRIRGVHHVR